MEKETDIIIYFRETRDIIAIIPNASIKDKDIVMRNEFEIVEVDSNDKYIIGNEQLGQLKFQNPKDNIIYLDDYRR